MKRKFCNVCRKRIEDQSAFRCEVCEYCVHAECHDFSVANCKECATYVPDQELVRFFAFHHHSKFIQNLYFMIFILKISRKILFYT